MTSGSSEACAFVRTRPELLAPDLEVLFSPPDLEPLFVTPRWLLRQVRRRVGLLRRGRKGTPALRAAGIVPIVLRPRSVGTIRLRTTNPLDAPAVDPGYLTDPGGEDLKLLVEGLELSRRILTGTALASLLGPELRPGPAIQGQEALESFVRRAAGSLQHPVGTCKMGVDDAAVVDPQLRVRGVEGLRVVDASVMPVIPRGHMNAPTVMIAEKAADLIRGSSDGAIATGRDSPRALG